MRRSKVDRLIDDHRKLQPSANRVVGLGISEASTAALPKVWDLPIIDFQGRTLDLDLPPCPVRVEKNIKFSTWDSGA